MAGECAHRFFVSTCIICLQTERDALAERVKALEHLLGQRTEERDSARSLFIVAGDAREAAEAERDAARAELSCVEERADSNARHIARIAKERDALQAEVRWLREEVARYEVKGHCPECQTPHL